MQHASVAFIRSCDLFHIVPAKLNPSFPNTGLIWPKRGFLGRSLSLNGKTVKSKNFILNYQIHIKAHRFKQWALEIPVTFNKSHECSREIIKSNKFPDFSGLQCF